MYIKRTISDQVKYFASKFPVVAVVGPRQSGKTTLITHIFKDKPYVSLENPDNRLMALEDPRAFLNKFPEGCIIDEIHKAPELFSYMQEIVDFSNQDGKFIITGSQNFLMFENISQTLAGRVAILKLYPFSFKELNDNISPFLNNFYDYIYYGGYPRIFNKNLKPNEWLPFYIETYIEKDVRSLKKINDLYKFQIFIKSCAGRIGQVLNLSSLANDCGITHTTAREWLNILEASFILFTVKPFYKNFNKRIIKMPKIYFYDTGLVCNLLGLTNVGDLKNHYLKGNLFENFIISDFLKLINNLNLNKEIYYWRDSVGHEIDMLIDSVEGIKVFEIKSSMTINKAFFKNINYLKKINNDIPIFPFIIYGSDDNYIYNEMQVLSWKNLDKALNQTNKTRKIRG